MWLLPRLVLSGLVGISFVSGTGCSAPVSGPRRVPLDATTLDARSPRNEVRAARGVETAASQERPEHAQAKVPVTAADPQWGSSDAPVTLVELSDFQCPFCARVLPTLEQLKATYGPSRLRIVWKHNPLPFHADARPAHEVSAAVFTLAGPTAFFRFHDLAFANQQALTPENFVVWAKAVGVSHEALDAWLNSGRAKQKVDEDLALAQRIGASGTPAFRINGVTLSGAQPYQEFARVVDEQLAAARRLTLGGTPPREVYVSLTNENFLEPPPLPTAVPHEDDEGVWRVPVSPDDPSRGPNDALVTIVQFSDFQCPFCSRVNATLKDLLKLYGRDVRLVWKDNPLPFHDRAKPAATFARLVYAQHGNQAFWRLHDALFESESEPDLSDEAFAQIAKDQGIAWMPIRTALAKGRAPAKVDESVELASEFAARGTPHFFINGVRLSGAQPLERFRERIDAELVKARALTDRAVPRARVYAEIMKSAKEAASPESKLVARRPDAPSRGPGQARVVIQQFSDFQCPFCQRVLSTLSELEKEFPSSIRIVWRHLPLPFHEHAQLAAEAAEEVLAQQGSAAFWAYHDRLFEVQAQPGGLDRSNLRRLALALGVDMARFDAALDARVHEGKVKADAALAEAAGITGTPAFLVNDYYLSGAQPAQAFRKLIRKALKNKQQP